MKYSIKKTAGFTLIEVMITVLLSLMLTFATSQVLITSNKSASSTDGLSQAQETGRFVMSFLASHIREAGSDEIVDLKDGEVAGDPVTTIPFIDCYTHTDLKNVDKVGIACSTDTNNGYAAGGAFNAGDHLAVAWVPPVPLDNSVPPKEDPSLIRDCTGVGGYAKNDIILNVFWVQPPTLKDPADSNSTGTPGSLWCQGLTLKESKITRFNAPQSIATGIDAMHVLYGEAFDDLSGVDQLRNTTKYVSAKNVQKWDHVYAVRVAILSSASTGSGNAEDTVYQLLDSDTYTINDNITRQIFSTTYALKNYK